MNQTATVERGKPAELAQRLGAPTRLDLVNGLLADVETATAGGRQYVMTKTLGLLRELTNDVARGASDLRRRAIQNTLGDLARESERMLPDARTFVQRAQRLAETLASF